MKKVNTNHIIQSSPDNNRITTPTEPYMILLIIFERHIKFFIHNYHETIHIGTFNSGFRWLPQKFWHFLSLDSYRTTSMVAFFISGEIFTIIYINMRNFVFSHIISYHHYLGKL